MSVTRIARVTAVALLVILAGGLLGSSPTSLKISLFQ